jgi:ABC-type glutathione transport system ATPase component
MFKMSFNDNTCYTNDEADVVAINDDRHASLNRFRRLTSNDMIPEGQLTKHPQLMLAKLMEETSNGGYVNDAMIIGEDIDSDIKLPMEQPSVSKVAVEVKDVTFTYGFGKKSLLTLKKINVSVPQGKIYALLGSSGCGESFINSINFIFINKS